MINSENCKQITKELFIVTGRKAQCNMNIIWNDLNTSYGSIYLFNKQSSIDTENESIYGMCNNYELLIERKVKPIRGKFELMFRNTVNSEHFNLLGQYNSIAKAKEAAEKFIEGE